MRTAYEYDTEGNIIRLLTEARDGGTICDLQYVYDRNGNRTAKAGTMILPDHSGGLCAQIRDIRYRYDRMDRLAAEVRDGEGTSYLYDLCGNRLEKRKGGRTERYRYNRKNQLVRRAAGGDAWDYTYDLQGNLVRETGPKGERQYLYDAENRQIRVLSGGKEIQENRYDGEGMRAGLTVNGRESTFLYGNGNLYAYCANDPVMYHDPNGDTCEHNTEAKKNVQQENVTGDLDNDISNNFEKTIISPEIEKKY